MEYGVPTPANDGHHKLKVLLRDPDTGKDFTVKFGNISYQDYTQHHNEKRRANYLARSAGIRDGAGRLTKDNPRSANAWSRIVLWGDNDLSFAAEFIPTKTSGRRRAASPKPPARKAKSPRSPAWSPRSIKSSKVKSPSPYGTKKSPARMSLTSSPAAKGRRSPVPGRK